MCSFAEIRDIPGCKAILKTVLKTQIQLLVEQLAEHTGEESVILTASVDDSTLSHLGSESGTDFLDQNEDLKTQFLNFCLQKQQKDESEDINQKGTARQSRSSSAPTPSNTQLEIPLNKSAHNNTPLGVSPDKPSSNRASMEVSPNKAIPSTTPLDVSPFKPTSNKTPIEISPSTLSHNRTSMETSPNKLMEKVTIKQEPVDPAELLDGKTTDEKTTAKEKTSTVNMPQIKKEPPDIPDEWETSNKTNEDKIDEQFAPKKGTVKKDRVNETVDDLDDSDTDAYEELDVNIPTTIHSSVGTEPSLLKDIRESEDEKTEEAMNKDDELEMETESVNKENEAEMETDSNISSIVNDNIQKGNNEDSIEDLQDYDNREDHDNDKVDIDKGASEKDYKVDTDSSAKENVSNETLERVDNDKESVKSNETNADDVSVNELMKTADNFMKVISEVVSKLKESSSDSAHVSNERTMQPSDAVDGAVFKLTKEELSKTLGPGKTILNQNDENYKKLLKAVQEECNKVEAHITSTHSDSLNHDKTDGKLPINDNVPIRDRSASQCSSMSGTDSIKSAPVGDGSNQACAHKDSDTPSRRPASNVIDLDAPGVVDSNLTVQKTPVKQIQGQAGENSPRTPKSQGTPSRQTKGRVRQNTPGKPAMAGKGVTPKKQGNFIDNLISKGIPIIIPDDDDEEKVTEMPMPRVTPGRKKGQSPHTMASPGYKSGVMNSPLQSPLQQAPTQYSQPRQLFTPPKTASFPAAQQPRLSTQARRELLDKSSLYHHQQQHQQPQQQQKQQVGYMSPSGKEVSKQQYMMQTGQLDPSGGQSSIWNTNPGEMISDIQAMASPYMQSPTSNPSGQSMLRQFVDRTQRPQGPQSQIRNLQQNTPNVQAKAQPIQTVRPQKRGRPPKTTIVIDDEPSTSKSKAESPMSPRNPTQVFPMGYGQTQVTSSYPQTLQSAFMQQNMLPGMQPPIQQGSQQITQQGTQGFHQTGLQHTMQSRTQTSIQSDMQAGLQPLIQTGSQPTIQQGMQPSMQQMLQPTIQQGQQELQRNQSLMQQGNPLLLQQGDQQLMQQMNQPLIQQGNHQMMQQGNPPLMQQGNQTTIQAGLQQSIQQGTQSSASVSGTQSMANFTSAGGSQFMLAGTGTNSGMPVLLNVLQALPVSIAISQPTENLPIISDVTSMAAEYGVVPKSSPNATTMSLQNIAENVASQQSSMGNTPENVNRVTMKRSLSAIDTTITASNSEPVHKRRNVSDSDPPILTAMTEIPPNQADANLSPSKQPPKLEIDIDQSGDMNQSTLDIKQEREAEIEFKAGLKTTPHKLRESQKTFSPPISPSTKRLHAVPGTRSRVSILDETCQSTSKTDTPPPLKRFGCGDCGKTFTTKHGLGVHFKKHTKEVPFECDVCGKHYSKKAFLMKHIMVHFQESQQQK